MRIVNSHYVPLSAPYPIIYCRGEVAMQTGTLIVIEDIYQDDPQVIQSNINEQQGKMYMRYPYGMKSHSHPVVSYGNKMKTKQHMSFAIEPNALSEGIVWDKVELSDVIVLCYSDEGIPSNVIKSLVASERYNDAYNGNKMTFQLSQLARGLRRLGVPFSIYNDNIQAEKEVKVTFIKQTPDNMFLYGLIEGFAPYLNILVRWSSDLIAMEDSIIDQIEDYRTAIAPHELLFSFESREDQWKPMVEKLNSLYLRK